MSPERQCITNVKINHVNNITPSLTICSDWEWNHWGQWKKNKPTKTTLTSTSGIVTKGKVRRQLPPNFWAVKNSTQILLSKNCHHNTQNLGLTAPILMKFRSKTKNLSTNYLLRWKLATVCQNSVRKLQCLSCLTYFFYSSCATFLT